MCIQQHITYSYGCRLKGLFTQCERLFDAQTNLQCDVTETENVEAANYCIKHLPKEGKATTKYTVCSQVNR